MNKQRDLILKINVNKNSNVLFCYDELKKIYLEKTNEECFFSLNSMNDDVIYDIENCVDEMNFENLSEAYNLFFDDLDLVVDENAKEEKRREELAEEYEDICNHACMMRETNSLIFG